MSDDPLDFQHVHDSFRAKILRYLSHMVGQRDAEDLTQEVFLKVDQALETFRGESQLSAWIYRIATNAALDRLRSPSFRPVGQKSLPDESESEIEITDQNAWTGEDVPSAETSVIRDEMNDCIRGIVDKLPDSYRTVIVLSEFEGFKNDEITDILSVSTDTVKIRLHRARSRLKEELEKACHFYRDERNEFACDRKQLIQLKK